MDAFHICVSRWKAFLFFCRAMKISAFPKCYLDAITREHTLTVFDWIEMAKQLDVEGLEMYELFFPSLDDATVDRVGEAIHAVGLEMPMMCCSPNFTNPDAEERKRSVEHEMEMIRITRRMGGRRAVCRVLTGPRYPEVSVEQGLAWVVEAINQLIPVAKEYDVVLGLENHFKESYWKYAEFAQTRDVYMRVLNAIPEREYFGVQYDPSNATVGGFDPVEFLREVVDRVVSMHASDRYLVPGASLEDMRQADGTLGYPTMLQHGVVGKGLNDYDAIFSILSRAGYNGWVSTEDGMNGMEELQESVEFLKRMRAKYFQSNGT